MRNLKLLAVLLLAGCASLSASQTFYKAETFAAQLNNTVLADATAATTAKLITGTQLTRVIGITDKAAAALQVADASYAAGSTGDASAKLTAITSLLAAVQACVTGDKTKLDTCLQGVPSL